MDKDIVKAKEIFDADRYTCVLVKDEIIYKSTERGIKPLLEWLENKIDLVGFSSVDKVIGKAAAFLYVLLGVKEIYAYVISRSAFDVLKKNKIMIHYDNIVDFIINRSGTGMCPMEDATKDIDNPNDALVEIKKTLKKLQK